jgi:carboxypeptidase PM20D1
VRPNVLPAEATAIINLRIHPRDTAQGLLQRARAAVKGLDGVRVELEGTARDASPVSSARSPSYALIASLARATAPDATVAPALVLAGTDSRLYAGVAENVYRHQPIVLTSEDVETIHGVNERLSIANLERMIRFYVGLVEAGAMR